MAELIPIANLRGPEGPRGPQGLGWSSTELGTSNLNDIVEPGVYRQTTSSNATSERNYPITNGSQGAGVLTVMRQGATSTQSLIQLFEVVWGLGASKVGFKRVRTGGVWSAWFTYSSMRVDNTAGRAIYTWDDTANREQLIYGDTGWRDVKAEWPLQNGWTSDGVWVRRIGSSVTFLFRTLSGSSATATQFLYPPNGWRFTSSIPFFVSNPVIINDTTIRNIAINGSTGTMQGVTGWTTGDRVVPIRFETNDPWPTTLPGTASGAIPN